MSYAWAGHTQSSSSFRCFTAAATSRWVARSRPLSERAPFFVDVNLVLRGCVIYTCERCSATHRRPKFIPFICCRLDLSYCTFKKKTPSWRTAIGALVHFSYPVSFCFSTFSFTTAVATMQPPPPNCVPAFI
ncbi:hypothetical protein IF1G_04362 [Cordyceps javanica]|uniref:Uncharacterized protein n=1 Tax=Cordyceps javanica TaxID=43265 RepID=A0A545V5X7_9HYPO|nr:hypothetical protein IF1G_04362 [Cordyceps javanica]